MGAPQCALGICSLMMERLEEAEARLTMGIDLEGGNGDANAFYNRGLARQKLAVRHLREKRLDEDDRSRSSF